MQKRGTRLIAHKRIDEAVSRVYDDGALPLYLRKSCAFPFVGYMDVRLRRRRQSRGSLLAKGSVKRSFTANRQAEPEEQEQFSLNDERELHTKQAGRAYRESTG
jgi:hypothetical protein